MQITCIAKVWTTYILQIACIAKVWTTYIIQIACIAKDGKLTLNTDCVYSQGVENLPLYRLHVGMEHLHYTDYVYSQGM